MKDKMKKLAENILKAEQGLVGANIGANPIRNLPGVIKIEIAKKIAGKPKKMNMGGVVPGRGGSFKGTR
tara:strand:+ start:919 stop:1125 length:207 start_codon:yes stop_codon:yes gene_type:complete